MSNARSSTPILAKLVITPCSQVQTESRNTKPGTSQYRAGEGRHAGISQEQEIPFTELDLSETIERSRLASFCAARISNPGMPNHSERFRPSRLPAECTPCLAAAPACPRRWAANCNPVWPPRFPRSVPDVAGEARAGHKSARLWTRSLGWYMVT
ncbi:hypothetical protein NEUTE2DRAFT_128581 [Neurospora tetrasperma FGSC 2509]|nr:hypothetical protein NEUTE2DRAFT_128581 [Neurospora tetrasperma FGSC 2509]